MRKLALSKNDDWQTLPPTAYHSEEIFELEKERVFYAGWVLVGRVDTLKKAGDYFCIDLIDEPLRLKK